jgi:hypothetical protein
MSGTEGRMTTADKDWQESNSGIAMNIQHSLEAVVLLSRHLNLPLSQEKV